MAVLVGMYSILLVGVEAAAELVDVVDVIVAVKV
jgi:hypothetical protein